MPFRAVIAAAALLALSLPVSSASELDESGVPVPTAVSASGNYKALALIEDLAGRWAGSGTATYPGGRTEALKCVAVYQRAQAPGEMREVIRCRGAEMQLKLGGVWAVKDGTISGSWTEETYSLSGRLHGVQVPSGFDFKATSTFADASVSVRMAGCKQEITMAFSQQVDKLSMLLRKC